MIVTILLDLLLAFALILVTCLTYVKGEGVGPDTGAGLGPFIVVLLLVLGIVLVGCILRGRFDWLPGGRFTAFALMLGVLTGFGVTSALATVYRRGTVLPTGAGAPRAAPGTGPPAVSPRVRGECGPLPQHPPKSISASGTETHHMGRRVSYLSSLNEKLAGLIPFERCTDSGGNHRGACEFGGSSETLTNFNRCEGQEVRRLQLFGDRDAAAPGAFCGPRLAHPPLPHAPHPGCH